MSTHVHSECGVTRPTQRAEVEDGAEEGVKDKAAEEATELVTVPRGGAVAAAELFGALRGLLAANCMWWPLSNWL